MPPSDTTSITLRAVTPAPGIATQVLTLATGQLQYLHLHRGSVLQVQQGCACVQPPPLWLADCMVWRPQRLMAGQCWAATESGEVSVHALEPTTLCVHHAAPAPAPVLTLPKLRHGAAAAAKDMLRWLRQLRKYLRHSDSPA